MSHVVYLLETQFRATLRTATHLLPLTARQGEVKWQSKLVKSVP
ncbi:hypothetical protein [Pilibacter termitis]|nr:hypothetical protein [Pilibacter termitis]